LRRAHAGRRDRERCGEDRLERAARIAQQYALANNLNVATMSYGLRRDGAGAAPLWKVTCWNESGDELGTLVLTAAKEP
jgi:hypothetical protein